MGLDLLEVYKMNKLTLILLPMLLWSSVGWADCFSEKECDDKGYELLKQARSYFDWATYYKVLALKESRPCTKELGECIKEVEQADGR